VHEPIAVFSCIYQGDWVGIVNLLALMPYQGEGEASPFVLRFEWRLVDKRELYLPYNAYRLHSDRFLPSS
jgi:hypothetical protein